MTQSATSTNFSEARLIGPAPRSYHLFGFGLYWYGDRDPDQASTSFVRTLCFCLFYVPVLALRSYRLAPSYEGWNNLGRVPLSRPAKWLSLFAAIAIPGTVAGLVGFASWSSPANVASRALAEAERLEAEGRVGDAAGLLASVAQGPTDRARPAADRLMKLVDSPASKRDLKERAAAFRAAVEVLKAGRWIGSPQSLHDSGFSLARDFAASDPSGALAILDAVAPLGPRDQAMTQPEATLRHELLEKIVAADPSNLELASKLASEYEVRGQLDRAEKLLAPLRDRLGEREGARVLGLCDARANRVDQAIPLLRAYAKPRLAKLAIIEDRLQALYKSTEERIIRQLETSRVSDFDYNGYRFATPAYKQKILEDYLNNKLKHDPEIARTQESVVAEAQVIPVALELGMLLLQHAQAQGDPSSRKQTLDEAEATFLGVSRMAGDRADYQLSLAQVYYWQGKHDQGKQLFEKVLNDHKRDPALLLQVANLLRDIGSHTEARPLAEEGYKNAPAGPIKEGCAVTRALLGDDIEDRIIWLRRGNSEQPGIKAMLCTNLAEQALNRGDEAQGIKNLKEAVALYESLPESIGTLNNGSLALTRLASLTGDPTAYERAGSMIEKAAALDPGNSLTMSNASQSLLEIGIRDLIGPAIDLKLLKLRASLDLLDFLAKDESERQDFAARLRSQPAVNRSLSLMEKVILLAPKNPDSYRAPTQVLGYRNDADRLRAILRRLESAELDLGDEINEERKDQSGVNDEKGRQATRSLLARFELILPLARAKGGPTFALAARSIVASRMALATLGSEADLDAMVRLAEEGFRASPSLGSRWYLMEALLFRGFHRLAQAEPGLAALRNRFARTLPPTEIMASIFSTDGPLKQAILKNPDIDRAIDLLRDSIAASPSYGLGPRTWSLLRAKYPEIAATLARRYFESESDRLEDEIQVKLRPDEPTQILKAYRIALMKGQPEDASKLLEAARARGIMIPIGAP